MEVQSKFVNKNISLQCRQVWWCRIN